MRCKCLQDTHCQSQSVRLRNTDTGVPAHSGLWKMSSLYSVMNQVTKMLIFNAF